MENDEIMRIQRFFFKAMIGGWTSDVPKITIPGMPSVKAFKYHWGDLVLLDCYSVTPESTRSAGTTTIWRADVPVWVMQYVGQYQKRVIPFLKQALRKTYEDNLFVGGRGAATYQDDEGLLYMNDVNQTNKLFEKFEGREEIYDTVGNVLLGYHDYRGMMLVELT